jgi:hypothetical protein
VNRGDVIDCGLDTCIATGAPSPGAIVVLAFTLAVAVLVALSIRD